MTMASVSGERAGSVAREVLESKDLLLVDLDMTTLLRFFRQAADDFLPESASSAISWCVLHYEMIHLFSPVPPSA